LSATTAKPAVNETIMRDDEPIHERLYKLGKKPQAKEEKQTAKPKTARNHRGKPVYDALSEMHKITEKKKAILARKRKQEERELLEKEVESTKLKLTEELSNKRFIKEYAKVLQHMEFHETDFKADDPNQRITFSQMGGILTTMGFVSSELANTHEDFKLVQTMWKMLGG
jgi:RecG-like helicase